MLMYNTDNAKKDCWNNFMSSQIYWGGGVMVNLILIRKAAELQLLDPLGEVQEQIKSTYLQLCLTLLQDSLVTYRVTRISHHFLQYRLYCTRKQFLWCVY